MPYPAEITGAFGGIPHQQFQYGPFLHGSTLFVFAFATIGAPGDPLAIGAFKSTDLGETWTAAGGGTKAVYNGPDIAGTSFARLCALRDQNDSEFVYVLYVKDAGGDPADPSASAGHHISRYDMDSEAWDMDSTSDPLPFQSDYGELTFEEYWAAGISGVAGGAIVMLWTRESVDVSGTLRDRCWRFHCPVSTLAWTGGTIIAPVDVDQDYSAQAVIFGAAGALGHGIMLDNNGTAYHALVWDSGAVAGTPEVIATGVTIEAAGATRSLQNEIVLAMKEFDGDTKLFFGASASSLTLSDIDTVATSSMGAAFNLLTQFDEDEVWFLNYSPSPLALTRATWNGSVLGVAESFHTPASSVELRHLQGAQVEEDSVGVIWARDADHQLFFYLVGAEEEACGPDPRVICGGPPPADCVQGVSF